METKEELLEKGFNTGFYLPPHIAERVLYGLEEMDHPFFQGLESGYLQNKKEWEEQLEKDARMEKEKEEREQRSIERAKEEQYQDKLKREREELKKAQVETTKEDIRMQELDDIREHPGQDIDRQL